MNYEIQDYINILICVLAMISIVIFAKTIFLKFNLLQHISFPKRESGIDGLRGYLALLVLFHHFSLTYYWLKLGEWKSPEQLYFQNFGKVGVSIFFIITGYLFIGKLLRNNFKVNLKELALSRVFRIMPLYIFVFIFIFFIVMFLTNFQIIVSPQELLVSLFRWLVFHGSTINDFEDTRRVIAGVDWTLKYEWFFYITLPIIAFLFRLSHKLSALFITLLVVYMYFYPFKLMAFNSVYLILFLIGGWMSYLESFFTNKILDSYFPNIFTILLFILSIFIFEPFSVLQILTMSLFFVFVVRGVSIFGLLKTDFSIYLGEISYSIYLLHGLVLFIMYSLLPIYSMGSKSLIFHLYFLPLITFVVILVSSFTYIYIEKPGMKYGKFLLGK